MSATVPTLRAIVAFTEKNGIPPSTADLADMLGLSRVASAHARIVLLEEAGLVARSFVRSVAAPRSLRVTSAGLALLR